MPPSPLALDDSVVLTAATKSCFLGGLAAESCPATLQCLAAVVTALASGVGCTRFKVLRPKLYGKLGSTAAASGCPCCKNDNVADSLGHFIFECNNAELKKLRDDLGTSHVRGTRLTRSTATLQADVKPPPPYRGAPSTAEHGQHHRVIGSSFFVEQSIPVIKTIFTITILFAHHLLGTQKSGNCASALFKQTNQHPSGVGWISPVC